MQLWGDKIYLGYGNSSNKGPAPNAGPVRVIAYHPQTGCFETEFTVDEEQIDRYRVIEGQLFIPGHDPLGIHSLSQTSERFLSSNSNINNTLSRHPNNTAHSAIIHHTKRRVNLRTGNDNQHSVLRGHSS